MSKMIGMWDGWWDGSPDSPYALGEITTMRLAAEWLDEACVHVEDWGCGSAYAKRFFVNASYRGVDGSGPKADVIADLREYTSSVDGVLMRHVLEHNYEWRRVLENALRSAKKRLALIIFTPRMPATQVLRWNAMRPDATIGVPDIGFAPFDLLTAIGDGWAVRETSHKTETVYGWERIMYAERLP